MSINKKRPTPKVTRLAVNTLNDPKSSKTAKSLAASVLAQTNTDKQTGAKLEDLASKVIQSPKYGDDAKTLAASVLSQSNKER
jgi:hypothetical protein